MSGERTTDCDVHCAVPDVQALLPYLDEHWHEFIRESRFTEPPNVASTYPSWSGMLATPGSEITLDRIRAEVLDRSDRAIVNAYYGVEGMTHPYFAPAVATAVNRWLQEQWLDRDERLLGSGVIAPQFTDAAVAEIERLASDARIVQVVVPARAWDPYGHVRYRPIWDAAAAHGLQVAITYGGATGVAPTPLGWLESVHEDHALGAQPFQTHVVSMIMSGIFDQHPELRIVLLESGWTWLPAFMWKMDSEWKAFRREVPWLTSLPSEYVRRHVRFTTQPIDGPQDLAVLGHVIDQIGADSMMMFGSDFPHRYPTKPRDLLKQLAPERRDAVGWKNAQECYRLAT